MIVEATVRGAELVLADLSHVERLERDRLGIESNAALIEAVNERRAWLLIEAKPSNRILAIFGVSGTPLAFPPGAQQDAIPVRYVWFLPTQYLIETYRRDVADPEQVKWVLDWIWSSIPTTADKNPVVLFNGATVENRPVLRWLRKVVGAKVSDAVIPAGPKLVPSHPFFLHHHPSYV